MWNFFIILLVLWIKALSKNLVEIDKLISMFFFNKIELIDIFIFELVNWYKLILIKKKVNQIYIHNIIASSNLMGPRDQVSHLPT